jgi:CPA2 family monovalent cation:H+ antiporter-2
MPDAHEPILITTIAIGLALAFVFGLVAKRLRMPPIVGYLLAGIAIGPFTPGFVADADIALELAEIGVILLMFGVGLHFSLRDLAAVRSIAIPGAVGQITVATVLGALVGLVLGWSVGEAIVLGLAISVASTVVLVRALMERGELLSGQGRIAVGWLIVEDLFTVVVLVLLPSFASLSGAASGADTGVGTLLLDVGLAVARAGLLAFLVIVVGTRVVPPLLAFVARLRDHELFTLSAVAIALGIAYLSYAVFGVSFALGAFLAGAIVSESDTSHQVSADALPLREIFSVLFFVSVGMLLDPSYLIENLPAVAAVVAVVVAAKALAAFGIVAVLGQPPRVGLTVAAGLAQIGEFSFILATSALALGLLPTAGVQLVVSAAIVSITVNPLLFRAIDPLARRLARDRWLARFATRDRGLTSLAPRGDDRPLRGHAVVVGSGRVGRLVVGALARRDFSFVVISEDRHEVERLRDLGRPALYGDATASELLEAAAVPSARVLVVAIPDAHAAQLIVQRARELNPHVDLVVRTHDTVQVAALAELEGNVQAVFGEVELGVQMTRYTLRRFGVSAIEAEAIAQGLRSRSGRPWPVASGDPPRAR